MWTQRQNGEKTSVFKNILKTEVFFSVLALRPHVNGVFGRRKWRFSKTLSRVEVFESAVFVFTCGRAKTKVFENDDVIIGYSLHSDTGFVYVFKMVDHAEVYGYFTWADSNRIACIQLQVTMLNVHREYLRINILKMLSVSTFKLMWFRFAFCLGFSCSFRWLGDLNSNKLTKVNKKQFCVYVWTGENDSNTLRVAANFFKNGEKNLHSQKYPHTEQGPLVFSVLAPSISVNRTFIC